MNKIFATFLSLQLILSPVALAQNDTSASNEAAMAEAATITPATEGKAIPYLNMALGMGSGVIGSQIAATCKLSMSQPSIMIYMAGSLAYIAKEIFGAKGQSSFTDEQISSIDMDNIQMDMLTKQKSSEEQNLKMIKGKKTWMVAITTIYVAATAFAIIETILSKTPPTFKPDTGACTTPNKALSDGIVQAIKLAYLSAGLFQTGKGIVEGAKSGSAMGIGGAALTAATQGRKQLEAFFKVIKGVKDVQEKTTPTMLNNGITRAILFGATGVVSGIITADLVKEQNKTEDNIKKLDTLIASFKKSSTSNSAINVDAPGAEAAEKSVTPDKMKELAEGNVAKMCWGNTSGGTEYSESACAKPMTVTHPSFDFKMSVPTLTSAGNLASDMAQAVASGDMAKADMMAGDLANMAARVKEVQDNVLAEYNKQLAAKGEPALDLNKAVQGQVASMQASAQSAAQNEGMDLTPSKAELAKDTPTGEVTIASVTPAAIPEPDMRINFNEGASVEEMPVQKTASLSEGLEQYESTVQDISKKSDVSIFKQVSNRYLLNYTRIFEKKKSIEDPSASAK